MPELMRKPLTEKNTEITFTGPIKNRNKVISVLRDFGYTETSDSVSWEEAFSHHDADNEPGNCLRGARCKEGITQKELSERIGIPQRHISEMETGKRPIGKKTAKILGKLLNISYKVFL